MLNNIDTTSTSDASKISTNAMFRILERVKFLRNRNTTRANYYTIWKNFNKFVLQLDAVPKTWEGRVYLFLANLVHSGRKSSTVRSYHSAIKSVLWDDKYVLQEDELELKAITRGCKLINDTIQVRMPIKIDVLELILFEIDRKYCDQLYLKAMLKALFAMGYYGMFRIGELTKSKHVLKAKDVYLASNKNKMKFYLHSSKTHDKESKPQKITITGEVSENKMFLTTNKQMQRHFCPFKLIQNYLDVRGRSFESPDEQFFILRGKILVEPVLVRNIMAELLRRMGLNDRLYSFHSMRSGRATNLHEWGVPVEQIKVLGRWKSNAIYKYLKF